MEKEIEIIANNPTNQAIADLESKSNPYAKNPLSSASGKYQFTRPTFEGVKRNNPDLPNLTFEDFQKNPDAQELYQQKLLEENNKTLEKHGLEVNPLNQYLMHWAGAPKGSALIQAKNEDVLGNHIKEDVLAKNKLDPKMSIGDFKRSIDNKLQKVLLTKQNTPVVGLPINQSNPTSTEIIGQERLNKIKPQNTVSLAKDPNQVIGEQRLAEMQKNNNIVPTPPFVITDEHEKQLQALDSGVANVQKQEETGNKNIVAAQHLQEGVQQFGPRWGMAFAQALFGDRQGALNSITGGALSTPEIAEARLPDENGNLVLKQIRINKNARGDLWYTDPYTGERLPDNIQITARSPEGALATSATRKQAENNLTAMNPNDSITESGYKTAAKENIIDRANKLPSENILINNITERTKQFGSVLDNALKNPQVQAAIKALALAQGGEELENQIQKIAILAKLPQDQIGGFSQYLRDLSAITKSDKEAFGKHAPGAGTADIPDLQYGAKGIRHWLAEREGSHQTQTLWNNIYNENSKTKSHQQIIRDFQDSPEYLGIQNYKKVYHAKIDGKKPDLANGAPVMNYVNGKLVLQRYNAKTGRIE
jgi:hypothetical protein